VRWCCVEKGSILADKWLAEHLVDGPAVVDVSRNEIAAQEIGGFAIAVFELSRVCPALYRYGRD
jgi:hypothetical protein